jgi:acylphosphatase
MSGGGGATSRRWLLSGRVQGVGFRWFVRQAAEEDGLTGWVRNLADGRVEVQAAGPEEALGALERRLREGPPAARVEAVETTPTTEKPDWTDFGVRR